ncbi:MAG: hypothetical protein JSS53_03910 [Proteobacteria bacterium]|nr:hypothetical protein [Pseudomonadota bacterium]
MRNIKARAFERHTPSAIERVPQEFIDLIPEVATILHPEVNKILDRTDIYGVMVINYLQPVAYMIEEKNKSPHFCCTLEFIAAEIEDDLSDVEKRKTQSVIIDFTTGHLMSEENYGRLAEQVLESDGEKKLDVDILGTIDSEKLTQAWSRVNNSFIDNGVTYSYMPPSNDNDDCPTYSFRRFCQLF